eukprot:16285_1
MSNASLSSIDPNRYIRNLRKNGKLIRAKADPNEEFWDIFNKHGASLCCCVASKSRLIPYYNFESTHFIYFQCKRYKLIKRNIEHTDQLNPNNYQTQTLFSYFTLKMSYQQLQLIDKIIQQDNSLFCEPYPIPLQDTMRKRGDELNNNLQYEDMLSTKPTLPKGGGNIFSRKSMTPTDLRNYSLYLHIILNNVQLLLNDELYQILKIDDQEIITLFKLLAYTKLETLKSEATKYDHIRCIKDPTKLKRKIGINFHTLFIVKRPLNVKNSAIFGFEHWSLKFEGNDQLMTIGFFAFNEEHGIVLTKLVPNTTLNRRLFWYYWPRDNVEEIQYQHFTTRWGILDRLYLEEISCELIGILLEEWLSYDNHAVYILMQNNCQHFVRDFVAPLNLTMAKRLSASFDHKVVKSAIPAGMLAETIDVEATCNNIHQRLFPILQQYQRMIKDRKSQEQKEVLNKIETTIVSHVSLYQFVFESVHVCFHASKLQNEDHEFKKNLEFVAQHLGINLSDYPSDDVDIFGTKEWFIPSNDSGFICCIIVSGHRLYLVPQNIYRRWQLFMSKSNIKNVIRRHEYRLKRRKHNNEYVLDKQCAVETVNNFGFDNVCKQQCILHIIGKTFTEIKEYFISKTLPQELAMLLDKYIKQSSNKTVSKVYSSISNIYELNLLDFNTVLPVSADNSELKYGLKIANNSTDVQFTCESNNTRYAMITHLDYLFVHAINEPFESHYEQLNSANNALIDNHNEIIEDEKQIDICDDKYCWYIDQLLYFMKGYQNINDISKSHYNDNTMHNLLGCYHHLLLTHNSKQYFNQFIDSNKIFQCTINHINGIVHQQIKEEDNSYRVKTKRDRIQLYYAIKTSDKQKANLQILDMIHNYLFHSYQHKQLQNVQQSNKFMNDFSNQSSNTNETDTKTSDIVSPNDVVVLECYQRLMMMGFDDASLFDIAHKFNGNVQECVDYLFNKNSKTYTFRGWFRKINKTTQPSTASQKQQYIIENANSNNDHPLNEETKHSNEKQLKLNGEKIVNNFGFGIYLSYWSNTEQKTSLNYVEPKYVTLKEELTTNSVYKLNLSEYCNSYNKANILLSSSIVDTHLIAKNVGRPNVKFGIKPKERFTINHMICLLVYCNYTELQRKFKQYCRPYKDEHIKVFINRNREIAFWSRYLFESCSIYGEKMSESDVLYTGLTCKLLFNSFDSTYFYCPLSTTPILAIAQNFSGYNGVIMKCKRGNESTMKLNVNWLSDYPWENERLIVGQSLKICNIIVQKEQENEQKDNGPISEWIVAVTLFEKLIDGLFVTFDEKLVSKSAQNKLLLLISKHIKANDSEVKTNDYIQVIFDNMVKNKLETLNNKLWINQSELLKLSKSNDKLCSYLYDFWEEKCGE